MSDAKSPRGRPRVSDQQKQEVRERIIASARALFLDLGFDHVSMRKVAGKTGLSPTSLYQYFPSKRHILHCLWEEVFAQLSHTCMARTAPLPGDPLSCIRTLMIQYMMFWIQYPDHFRVVFMNEDLSSLPGEDVDARRIMDQMPLFRTLMAAIDQGIRQGLFICGDGELIWQTLFLHCQGTVTCLITIREIPWRPATELIARSIDTTLKGLSGSGGLGG